MRNRPSTLTPISQDFFTHGPAGIGLNVVEERRQAERARDQAASLLATDRATRSPRLRARLGAWLIRTGETVIGDGAPAPQPTTLGG